MACTVRRAWLHQATLPGARDQAVSWADASGNLWMFGGYNFNGDRRFNDLWKYEISTGNWTWMKGSNTVNQTGVYGTQGTEAATNTPGARQKPVSWTDAAGNFWLFGGSAPGGGYHADLWRYNTGSNNWTFMKGYTSLNHSGSYGTQGTTSSLSRPSGRQYSTSWTDASGNLWLFGGLNNTGRLNDLWKYDVSTNNWTWMKGTKDFNLNAVYGTMGTAAAANTPGSRDRAVGWTDASGNLWLFGGRSANGYLNDLWKYNISTGNWTWMKGSNSVNQTGVYGTQGTAASGNTPGARESAVSWTDAPANSGYLAGMAMPVAPLGYLNDLWTYDISTGNWTWLKGSNSLNQTGVYGTQGVSASTNTPGARNQSVSV